MFITRREIYQMYPYMDKKDIKLVMDIKQPRVITDMVMLNWKPRPVKFYSKKEIENLFWTWQDRN